MKKLILFTLLIVASAQSWAQKDGLSYQAIILDPLAQEIPGQDISTNFLPNAALQVRFIINSGSEVVYEEIQETRTDAFGMINLFIGEGTPSNGDFTEIEWDGTPKDLSVEINLNGSFKFLNKEPLTFIPYSFHRNITASGTLTVDGEVNFKDNLVVNGTSTLNDALTVERNAATRLTGTLDVDGETKLNSSLEVTGNHPTKLTGTLDVDLSLIHI